MKAAAFLVMSMDDGMQRFRIGKSCLSILQQASECVELQSNKAAYVRTA